MFGSMTDSQSVLFGGMATFDVYGLQNFNSQASSSHMCVVNHQGDDYSTENVVAAGWMVSYLLDAYSSITYLECMLVLFSNNCTFYFKHKCIINTLNS
jgi:hypothetical protein